jgi:hypothetical protein
MTSQETPRGWIAIEDGLAARGSTRAEAQARLSDIVFLVRRLAARPEETLPSQLPSGGPTLPPPPASQSPTAPPG